MEEIVMQLYPLYFLTPNIKSKKLVTATKTITKLNLAIQCQANGLIPEETKAMIK
jgi:hypothetical protein